MTVRAMAFAERGELKTACFDGSESEARRLCEEFGERFQVSKHPEYDIWYIVVQTIAEGRCICSGGDYLMKRGKDCWVCPPDVFDSLYDEENGNAIRARAGIRWAICWNGDNREILELPFIEEAEPGSPMNRLRVFGAWGNGIDANVKVSDYIEISHDNRPKAVFDQGTFDGSFQIMRFVKEII